MKFKIGDKVRYIGSETPVLIGKTGIVKRISEKYCFVEFDEKIVLGSKASINLSCLNKNLEIISQSKSTHYELIVTDTNKVIIINKLTGKKGIATCHPDDKFDVSVGVKLAMDRLNGVEEVKTTPRKIGDLPIGTKIKILKETQSWGKVNAGDIGSISKHSVYCTEINFSNQSNWSIESDVLEHEYFEVVDESNISSAEEIISFDDKVKLVKSLWDDFTVEMKK